MPTLGTVKLDCSFGEKPKDEVKRDKQKWPKMPSYQSSCPNISCMNISVKGNDDCLKRVHSFDNIDIEHKHAKHDENLKLQIITIDQSEHQNLTGARRKTKSNCCTRKGSNIRRSKENRRTHSFKHKNMDFKTIFKGI